MIFLAFLHKCFLQTSVSHCGQVSSPYWLNLFHFDSPQALEDSASVSKYIWWTFKPKDSASISNWTKYRPSNAQNIVPEIIIINCLVVYE